MSKNIPKVFFNASVILSGINSPTGGSAYLLKLVKQKKIKGIISETILDEAKNNSHKINYEQENLEQIIKSVFLEIIASPDQKIVNKYDKIIIDTGDSHVLASSEESKAKYLVTLDSKHLLILKDKIKKPKILSPKELIEALI